MTPPNSTPPQTALERHTRHGLTIERPAGRADRKFRARIRFRQHVHHLTLAETVEDSFRAAILARREIHAGRWTEYQAATRLRGTCSLATLVERYQQRIRSVQDRLEDRTIRSNAAAFRNFLGWAMGNEQTRATIDLSTLTAQALTPQLVADFIAHYLAPAGEDRALREQRRRGADAVLRQARSLFSRKAMLLYADFALPDLRDFLNHCTLPAEPRLHLPITPAALAEMHTAAEQLRQARDPLWLVHALHKFPALRTDEVVEARVEWFARAPWGQVFLSVLTRPYFEPKKSQGHVPIAAEIAAQFAPYVQGRAPEDHLIPASSPSARRKFVEREHAAWMRRYLPRTDYAKAGYELRRWAAQTMRLRYGDAAAQAFLRHATHTVAARHYFEHFYPWQTHGTDVGIRLADAAGQAENNITQIWLQGSDALAGLTDANPQVEAQHKHANH